MKEKKPKEVWNKKSHFPNRSKVESSMEEAGGLELSRGIAFCSILMFSVLPPAND